MGTRTDRARLVEALIRAYGQGLFPMADPFTGGLEWFCPDPRMVIPLGEGEFHVPRSVRQRVRSGRFRVTSDTAFEAVVRACAEDRPRPGGESWIDGGLMEAYLALFEAGHAHSIEAWRPEEEWGGGGRPRLVGGLFGVVVGGLFAGESMFCRPAEGGTDASKVCLVHLVGHLRRRGFRLLDAQFPNAHLMQFGARTVSRRQYLAQLAAAVQVATVWAPFEPEAAVTAWGGRR